MVGDLILYRETIMRRLAFLLRIDSSDAGLRYAVLPMSGCPH